MFACQNILSLEFQEQAKFSVNMHFSANTPMMYSVRIVPCLKQDCHKISHMFTFWNEMLSDVNENKIRSFEICMLSTMMKVLQIKWSISRK